MTWQVWCLFAPLEDRQRGGHVETFLITTPKTSRTEHKPWKEVLPQDTTHRIQRLCYQRGSPCQDPASNRTTRRPPDHRKETPTKVVWICLPFIRSGQNHLARHSEMGKKTRQTEEDVGRQHQGMVVALGLFFPRVRGLFGECSAIHSPPARFLLLLLFFVFVLLLLLFSLSGD